MGKLKIVLVKCLSSLASLGFHILQSIAILWLRQCDIINKVAIDTDQSVATIKF